MTWMHTATSTHPFDDLQVSPSPDVAPLARAAEALLHAVKPLHTLDALKGTPAVVRVVGSPGSGRTLLARRVAQCLRPVNRATLHEINVIRRIAGLAELEAPVSPDEAPRAFPHPKQQWIPLRAPHFTVSAIGMFGSGVYPGEIHLAHGGLLLLDEVHELQAPIQAKLVDLMQRQAQNPTAEPTQHTRGTPGWAFPARFTLITLENPCGCGNLNNTARECVCTTGGVLVHRARNLIAEAFPDAPVIDLDVMRRVAA
ncbi:MAG: hypothetical protein A2Y78_08440 [Acidobacteria bacterium RBG_13_68_16]|nr:MAG: hypothetical protein A2Y78_08440 [Acidobacteria bacterium RBG_13_68_16]